jgi:hypothetical protein
MLTHLIANLIFMVVLLGLILFALRASEQNNRLIARIWGVAIGMAIATQMALL